MRKKGTLDNRLHQAPSRQDGTPGLYYLRVRVAPHEAWAKNIRVDISLETNNRAEARARAAYIFRVLNKLGRRVLGDFDAPHDVPRFTRYRHLNKRRKHDAQGGQMRLNL